MKHWEKLRLTAVDSQTPGVRASCQTVSCTIDGDATPHGLVQRAQWRLCRELAWTEEKRVSLQNDGEEKCEEKNTPGENSVGLTPAFVQDSHLSSKCCS